MAQFDKYNKTTMILIAAFITLFIAGDTLSTYHAINHGAEEMNPLMKMLLPLPWAFVALKVGLLMAMFPLLTLVSPKIRLFVLVFWNMVMLGVVVQNIVQVYAN